MGEGDVVKALIKIFKNKKFTTTLEVYELIENISLNVISRHMSKLVQQGLLSGKRINKNQKYVPKSVYQAIFGKDDWDGYFTFVYCCTKKFKEDYLSENNNI